ncbi:MAG: glycerol-3-phosphate 1-O-acyltransferase PlsY [Gammaproteobacteria bacterium]|jgi:acyl phosphate:glycerol-3-phosphate acyltransferase|nr:glycerol-3-phosphate 1-O-acyltransferase PlsY [Gammaproteobacteria bacterium]MBT4462531.1 glycerol-3-phosphate 1-O-acyltransferase PlsY [Gammaproteobacteria bacterium]MBT4654778.1 glycerol-3-phosphate 1-O-acyltransferase PlsY [Gammaproteobacteria bacterium]MBT5116837.1 glycerol-3-phosphate 1-O-acyltransferase PlsY [Gammaproteobacteria bacterium]MBT5761651.1 glycerol-3-phosphate 1-O-acyltransferase PlsY [Gammaproteobacteria bacterium]
MLENIFNLEMLIISVGLYLIGSIPFAIISAKLFNLPDPRSFGSKNPGATNVLRSGNKYAAFLTLVGDGLKGLIPVLFLMETTIPVYQIYLLSFFLLVGHTFPVTLNFKGGKGVATSIGILLSLNPIVAALLIITWLLTYYIFKVSGLSALIGFLLLPLFMFIASAEIYMVAISFANVFFIFMTHKKNIVNFLSDES